MANGGIEQVETLLKTQDPPEQPPQRPATSAAPAAPQSIPAITPPVVPVPVSMGLGTEPTLADFTIPTGGPTSGGFINDFSSDGLGFQDTTMGNEFAGESFPWEMVGLGLEEPLPAQDTIDDLYGASL